MAIEGNTIAEYTTDVRDRLDEASVKQWTDTEIARWINDGLADIAQKTGYLEDTQDITTLAGTANYALHDNFLNVKRVTYFSTATNEKKLYPITFWEVDKTYPHIASSGDPDYYYLWKNQIWFYPKPATADKTIRVYMFKWESISGTTKSNLWKQFKNLPVLYALMVCKQKEEEYIQSQMYEGKYLMRIQELIDYLVSGKQVDELPTIKNEYDVEEGVIL